jgi:hypothetical protein
MTSKRHHLVPQFYLEFFTDRSGANPVVWVYDKEQPTPRAQLPKDTTVESHFHTFTRADGTRTDFLETELSKLEGVAKPILDRWRMPKAEVQPRELAEVAYFLGVMHARVRRTVERTREMMGEFAIWSMQQLASDPERHRQLQEEFVQQTGTKLPPPEEMLEVWKNPEKHFKISGNTKPALQLNFVTMMREVAQQLRTMNWCLCEAPRDTFFITCDAPLNIFLQDGRMGGFGGGLALPHVEVAFPVSPEVCLYIDRRHQTTRRKASAEFVAEINRRVAFQAERWVIAHVRSKRIQRLVAWSARSRTLPKLDRDALRKMWSARYGDRFKSM